MLDRLTAALVAAGVPLERIEGRPGALQLIFQPRATAEDRTKADQIVRSFDWSPRADAAWRRQQKMVRHPAWHELDTTSAARQDQLDQAAKTPGATLPDLVQRVNLLTRQVDTLRRALLAVLTEWAK